MAVLCSRLHGVCPTAAKQAVTLSLGPCIDFRSGEPNVSDRVPFVTFLILVNFLLKLTHASESTQLQIVWLSELLQSKHTSGVVPVPRSRSSVTNPSSPSCHCLACQPSPRPDVPSFEPHVVAFPLVRQRQSFHQSCAPASFPCLRNSR